ncbi:hypothetical protein BDV39DRAFT_169437 [Aspergillus sergii]|uniref:Uncharacterized protein n=1 Tax=Aspergillus sergii TaxID=1034303 RepID=A0A5N6XGQ9_9EURO|nr:hypothetical protein BDV39DRAFT_169437 [Aspergillus sergii]
MVGIETVEPPDFINSQIILECLFLLGGLPIALNFVYHRRKGAGAIPLFGQSMPCTVSYWLHIWNMFKLLLGPERGGGGGDNGGSRHFYSSSRTKFASSDPYCWLFNAAPLR